jgi:hypothetical protein
MTALDPSNPPPATHRPRRWPDRLAVVLAVVAALCITLAAISTWTRATVFDTERYVAVVTDLGSDARVISVVSQRLATQTMAALDVEARVASVLPPRATFLAPTLTERIEASVARGISQLIASDRAQAIWSEANRRLHTRLVAVLRDEAENVTLEDGVLTLDLFPLVVSAISELQAQGVIPAEVPLPDLSAEADLEAARERLGTALGVPIPAELGQVAIADAPVLQRLKTAVGTFDALVIWMWVAAAATALGAVLLASRRGRMVLLIALLAIGATSIVRLLIPAGIEVLDGAVADPQRRLMLEAITERLQDDLFVWLASLLLVLAVVAVAAWIVSHLPWRSWTRPSGDTLRTLVVSVVAGGIVWAIVGRELTLLAAVAVACIALWGSRANQTI